MTDDEWLACDDPKRLLEFLLRKRDRKFRLAAVAACRDFADFLPDEHRPNALEALAVAERFADGRATGAELEAAAAKAAAIARALADAASAPVAGGNGWDDMRAGDAWHVASAIDEAISRDPEDTFSSLWTIPGTEFLVARTLREVFGPPTPGSFDRGWLTATVTALARAAYEEGDIGRQPVLADALEDAGCAEAALLGHLRGSGPHVRGCWAVDLLLGKG